PRPQQLHASFPTRTLFRSGVIRSEADRLEHMVQDVMDLARVGSAEFRLDVRPVDLSATLGETITAHQNEAKNASVTLLSDLPKTDRKSTRLNSSHDQISYA